MTGGLGSGVNGRINGHKAGVVRNQHVLCKLLTLGFRLRKLDKILSSPTLFDKKYDTK
jgi:hypothetical protein